MVNNFEDSGRISLHQKVFINVIWEVCFLHYSLNFVNIVLELAYVVVSPRGTNPFVLVVKNTHAKSLDGFDLIAIEKPRVLGKANSYLSEEPRTVTFSYCERSAGGRHDYYSEGDYWWPDPENPDGPFIRRDGETYPELFLDHRQTLILLLTLHRKQYQNLLLILPVLKEWIN